MNVAKTPFEGEVFGQEVKAFFLAPYFDDAIERLGEAKLRALIQETFGVDLSEVRDQNAWVTLRFIETLIPLLKPENDPAFFKRMGRIALSARYLGFLRPLIRAVGTVSQGYFSFADTLERFNKIGVGRVRRNGAQSVTIDYQPIEGAPAETNRDVCDGRLGQLEALPVLFDRPPAKITHSKCLHDGDEACVYEISFTERSSRLGTLFTAAVGGALGAAVAVALAAPWWAGVLVGTVFAWAVARQAALKAALADQTEAVAEQQDALLESAVANEARFSELREAKAAVDRQVEIRTAELQQTTEQLAETLEQVQSLSQARSEFFSNISHELRTPLTLLMAPLMHLARGEEPPGGRTAALNAMERNSDRLLRMIDQLLDLARVESGAAVAERAPVRVESLLRAVADGFSAAADSKGVTIDVRAHRGPTAALDAGWMETALTNLVANALKYTDAGGTIILSSEDRGDELLFEVRDDGRGIEEEALKSLFDRFARGSGPAAGSGIGLSLVHEAARLHSGKVLVESAPGEGSAFRILIPRLLAEGEAVKHTVRQERFVEDACPERAGPDNSAPLALVAEDNPDVRRFIVDILGSTYRVRSVRNGEEALAAIAEQVPDLLVTDISMPTMSGLELTRSLRADVESRNTPVILVTARGEPDQILEGFDAGADDYVVKPFHGRELMARADALVRARRMAGRLVHQERLATVGLVAASVAHHIRNPLNALIGGLPAVRSRLKDVDAGTDRMFEVFIDCADRIDEITTDLLDLSRVDRAEAASFAPGRGLAASVRLMETRFGDSIDIERDIDEETQIEGRPGDMHHVFLNLLDNAARAIDGHGKLRVTGRTHQDRYIVRVEDNGAGIPLDLRERVFEHFVTTRDAGEGTGLGLAIAHEVVQQHGGSIRAGESDLGGAELELSLPLPC